MRVAQLGTTNGTVTDLNGNYSISVPKNASLQFSFIGYNTQTVAVNGRTTINVVMEEDTELLEDVVIIGYGSQKKANVTGSIASMAGDNLREVASADFTRALAGRVAGVTMTQTNSKPGASMEIRIRGTRSLSASNEPLIVLDERVLLESIPYVKDYSQDLKDATPSTISLDYILDERMREFYGEGFRWFDLVRTQTWEKRAASYTISDGVWGAHEPKTYNRTIEKYMYLRPIPQSQLDGMEMTEEEKAAFQNPGYTTK